VNRPAIENDPSSSAIENDAGKGTNEIDVLSRARDDMRNMIIALSKQATLTVADASETEQMGVSIDPSRGNLINAERHALNRSHAKAQRLWLELDGTMIEIQRGIGSSQHMIDPEDNWYLDSTFATSGRLGKFDATDADTLLPRNRGQESKSSH
jgi:hypothetical protein